MSTKVLFTVQEDEILVETVAKFPCLYDFACPTYKKQATKDSAWDQVAAAVPRSVDDCKKRWRNIKDTYLKRQKKRTGTRSSASSTLKKWALADMLSFLDRTDRKWGNKSNDSLWSNTEDERNLETNYAANIDEHDSIKDDSTTSERETDFQNEATRKSSHGPKSRKRQRNPDKIQELEDRSQKRLEIVDNLNPNREDDVDVFFKSIALSVKKLRRELINEAKIKSLQMVFELERRN